jgi:hypothetical protein
VAEIARQLGRRSEVDSPAAEQARKLFLHGGEVEQRGFGRGFELDEEIDIAVGSGRALQDGTEKRQPADAMPLAEARQLLVTDGQPLHWIIPSLPRSPPSSSVRFALRGLCFARTGLHRLSPNAVSGHQ